MAAALRSRLRGWADIHWSATAGSTNTELLAQTRAGATPPRLLGTHQQHQGRGRSNRNFQTAAGDALMFSCAFEVALPIGALPTLSVLLGLVACETLASRLKPGHQLRLKWPNDLQWGDAKLAGILTESAAAPRGGNPRLVVGIGINLRGGTALGKALGRAVADWQTITTEHPTLASDTPLDLCVAIAGAWRAELAGTPAAWCAERGLPTLPARFAAHDALAGRVVTVQDQGKVLMEGVAAGVAEDGRLQLRTITGLQTVTVGDISVRPEAASPPAA